MRVAAVLAAMGPAHGVFGSPSPAPRTPSPVVSRPTPSPTAALFPGSTSIGGLDIVGCGAKSAWAKVVANVVLNCPAGATQSVTDIHHYPSTTCLRRL